MIKAATLSISVAWPWRVYRRQKMTESMTFHLQTSNVSKFSKLASSEGMVPVRPLFAVYDIGTTF
jgi:hypothetical protein